MIEILENTSPPQHTAFLPGQPIVSPDLRAMVASQNTLWARGGLTWSAVINCSIWSPTWSVVNNDEPGVNDLDQFSPAFRPKREEVDAYNELPDPLTQYYAVTVTAHCAGAGEIEVALHKLGYGKSANDVADFTQIITISPAAAVNSIGATTFMLPLTLATFTDGYQVRFRARYSTTELVINTLHIHEHRYISESSLSVHLWGVPSVVDNDSSLTTNKVLAWEDDGLGVQFTGVVATAPQLSSEPDLAHGVRSVLSGATSLATGPTKLGFEVAGLVVAVAIRPYSFSAVDKPVLSKQGNGAFPSVYIYTRNSTVYANLRLGTATRTVQLAGLTSDVWHDVVLWWRYSTTEIQLFVNEANSPVSTGLSRAISDDTTPWFLNRNYAGSAYGTARIAMPYVATGDFTRVEVDQVRTWRRSILGCW